MWIGTEWDINVPSEIHKLDTKNTWTAKTNKPKIEQANKLGHLNVWYPKINGTPYEKCWVLVCNAFIITNKSHKFCFILL